MENANNNTNPLLGNAKYEWLKLLAPILVGIIVGWAPFWYTTKSDELRILHALIPDLTSSDLNRNDMALLILEELAPRTQGKIMGIMKRKGKIAAKDTYTGLVKNTDFLPSGVHASNLELLSPELKAAFETEIERLRKKDRKQIQKEIENDRNKSEYNMLLKRGDSLLNKGECFAAMLSFYDATKLRPIGMAAKSGVRVARSCIEPEKSDAFFHWTIQRRSEQSSDAAVQMQKQYEQILRQLEQKRKD